VIALAEPGAPAAIAGVAELSDRLRSCAAVQPAALVVLAPGAGGPVDASDAVFAPPADPSPAAEEPRAQEHEHELAPAAVIVDSSRPLAAGSLVDRALTRIHGRTRAEVTP
jgi:hypothetical protein